MQNAIAILEDAHRRLSERTTPLDEADVPAVWRLLAKVTLADSGCWLWNSSSTTTGYGQIKFRGRPWVASRVAYTVFVGPIPDGLEIDHVKARGCTSRLCVNPKHLEPVTGEENIRRHLESLIDQSFPPIVAPEGLPQLLHDAVSVFAATGRPRAFTSELLEGLQSMRPDAYAGWAAERLAAELTAAGLKRTSKQVKIAGRNSAGYQLSDFLAVE